MKSSLNLFLLILLSLFFHVSFTNILCAQTTQKTSINEAALIELIRPQIEQLITKPWKKAVLDYLYEESFGGYGVTVWDTTDQAYTLDPGDYNLSTEESNSLNKFILQADQKKACNTLQISLYPDKTYHIKTIWDVKKHKLQLRHTKSEKENLTKILPTSSTNSSIDMTRYTKVTISKSNKKVKELPVNESVFCEFYVRLYALLGDPHQVGFEGFTYLIYDKEKDFYFSASLTGFGAGYFAADDSNKSKKLIEEFHASLYSEHLILKECSVEYEHDFGSTKFGFKEGQFIKENTYD